MPKATTTARNRLRVQLGRTAPAAHIARDLAKLKGVENISQLAVDHPGNASLVEFARHCGFEPAAHHRMLIDALEQVERGDLRRVMIMMPPGSAKSTYTSFLFPAWFVGRNANAAVIAASHTLDLAKDFGRRVRNLVNTDEYREIFPAVRVVADSKAADRWNVTNGSLYKAAGVGTAISGRRGDVLLIDDPVAEQSARSETERENVYRWYLREAETRLKPGGRVLLVMTRWHEDDLAGRLLEVEPDRWKVIKFPMLAGVDDPLGRQPGERLWPEYFTDEMVLSAQKNPAYFEAMYQQNPTPMEGAMFKVGRLFVHAVGPRKTWTTTGADGKQKTHRLAKVRRWDLAASTSGDWTVGTLMAGPDEHGKYWVLDVVRFRADAAERNRIIRQIAEKDGRDVRQAVPQDPGAAGKEVADSMIRLLAGFAVAVEKESGSKELRADPFAAQVNAGNVGMVKAPWNGEFVEELRQFPLGKHDDQVDTSAGGFNLLARPRGWVHQLESV